MAKEEIEKLEKGVAQVVSEPVEADEPPAEPTVLKSEYDKLVEAYQTLSKQYQKLTKFANTIMNLYLTDSDQ